VSTSSSGSGAPFDPTAAWKPPKTTGVTVVDPEELYAASAKIVALREGFINVATSSVTSLYENCGDMAGTDLCAVIFAMAYDPLARDVVSALATLAGCIGGVPEGLVVSANNYAAADAAATPGAPASSPRAVPSYGPTWFIRPAPSSGSTYMSLSATEPFEVLASRAVSDPLTILTNYFPTGHQDRLIAAESALNAISQHIDELAEQLNNVLTTLSIDTSAKDVPRVGRFPGVLNTNQVNSWQTAIANFCSRIWGAAKAKYGGRGLPAHPLGLAGVAAEKLAALCLEHRSAIDRTRSALENRLGDAGLATLLGLLGTEFTFGLSDLFAEAFDDGALTDCAMILLTEYLEPIQRITEGIQAANLDTQLAQALAAAPTMAAVEALADSIGDRAEHDFSYTGLKTPGSAGSPFDTGGSGPGVHSNKMNSGHPATSVPYPIDLAGQEGTQGAHVISTHVGITDAQLLARMTNTNADGSGTFATLGAAQNFVQADLGTSANEAKIGAWIEQCKNLPAGTNPPTLFVDMATNQVTGSTVIGTPGDYQVINGHGVQAVLLYNKDYNPPFIVSTAYPTD
jgi:hypothetical protein